MPCRSIPMPGGGAAIVCGPRPPRTSRCQCGARAELVCDWPSDTRKSGTCDKPICETCARNVDGKDFCPFHRGEPPKTQAEMDFAGDQAATEAARILGVKR